MPKIEVAEKAFFTMLGKKLGKEELIDILPGAKAELDDWDTEKSVLKIELNDTNRPDLWSTAGLARQLGLLSGAAKRKYEFLSSPGKALPTGERVIKVDPGLEKIRPYITAFAAKGKPIDESFLIDIIQTQEKICHNFGQKRKGIAMGAYRADLVNYPVTYKAADPKATQFVPLGFERKLSLAQILTDHPKGIEFGWIVKDFPKFPYLEDAKGDCLSFPPIINSSTLGALVPGDDNLFIELTGTDMDSLLLAASIVACDLCDFGYEILPVKTIYPYDTPYGREVVSPFYFQKQVSVSLPFAEKLLGEKMKIEDAAAAITRAGNDVSTAKDTITIAPAPYRNDFLHQVDIVEEIVIGRGLSSFAPEMPKEYTIGRLLPQELFARTAREIMVGLGYQEMIYNYLGSKKDFIEKMCLPDEGFIHISNPMSENYAMVRKSILPNLLESESVSGYAVYPHKIFEIGKVIYADKSDNYGALTRNYLGFLWAEKEAGFNDIYPEIAALFYYLSKEFVLKEVSDPRFIGGRSAAIIHKGKQAGIFGELHPSVLVNWNIEMPAAAAEIDLDTLLSSV